MDAKHALLEMDELDREILLDQFQPTSARRTVRWFVEIGWAVFWVICGITTAVLTTPEEYAAMKTAADQGNPIIGAGLVLAFGILAEQVYFFARGLYATKARQKRQTEKPHN